MALSNMTILDGCTISAAGGTSKTLGVVGQKRQDMLKVADNASADFLTRRYITFTAKEPTLQSDGTYSKGKMSAVVNFPKLDTTDGKYKLGRVRIEHEWLVYQTAAEIAEQLSWGCQILMDSDTLDFRTKGVIA